MSVWFRIEPRASGAAFRPYPYIALSSYCFPLDTPARLQDFPPQLVRAVRQDASEQWVFIDSEAAQSDVL